MTGNDLSTNLAPAKIFPRPGNGTSCITRPEIAWGRASISRRKTVMQPDR
jgi:hypothetical protein